MVKYLKKKKIHKLAQVLGYSVPALKKCSYRYYRGSEWLTFPAEQDDEYYEFYVCKSYMSIELYRDEIFSKSVLSNRFINSVDLKELLENVS